MRIILMIAILFTSTGCTSAWGPEKQVPRAETRQQTCQNSVSPDQTNCGHFPEPEFH